MLAMLAKSAPAQELMNPGQSVIHGASQTMLGLRNGAARQLVSLLAGPRGITRAVTALDAGVSGQHMSSGPKTATPPPNAARGATADLCDIYVTDPVDIVSQRGVQIMEPIFK